MTFKQMMTVLLSAALLVGSTPIGATATELSPETVGTVSEEAPEKEREGEDTTGEATLAAASDPVASDSAATGSAANDPVANGTMPGDGTYLGWNFEGTDQPIQIYGYDGDEEIEVEMDSHLKDTSVRSHYCTKRFGLDVSKWQVKHHTDAKTKQIVADELIDWNKVKAEGVEFVIVKIGGRNLYADNGVYTLYEDPFYKENLQGAIDAGIKVGGYFYSQAINETEAIEEAKYMLNKVAEFRIDLPLFFDYEWSGDSQRILTQGGDVANRTKICDAFCNTIQCYGYATGVYSSNNILKNYLDTKYLGTKYKVWLARYLYSNPPEGYRPDSLPNDSTAYPGVIDFYQFTSRLYVDGIPINTVDHNFWYDDGTINGSKDYSRVFKASYYAEKNPDVVTKVGTEPADLLQHFVDFGMAEARHGIDSFDVWAYLFYNTDLYSEFKRDYKSYYEHYANQGYKEGRIAVEPAAEPDNQAVFRLYNRWTGEHFYTLGAYERNYLILNLWEPEGIAWRAPLESTTPVYRLYNPYNGDHHYTPNSNERDMLIGAGWKDEGTAWYSDDDHRAELYRVYNPKTKKAGAHHYTANINEAALLIQKGWRGEGTAWYGVRAQ